MSANRLHPLAEQLEVAIRTKSECEAIDSLQPSETLFGELLIGAFLLRETTKEECHLPVIIHQDRARCRTTQGRESPSDYFSHHHPDIDLLRSTTPLAHHTNARNMHVLQAESSLIDKL